MKKILYAIALLTFAMQFTFGQTLINKEWEQTHGQPSSDFNYQASVRDNSLSTIILGSTYDPIDKEKFYLVKYSGMGDFLWSVSFSGRGWGKDFGIDVIVDSKGDIYCTGVSYDTSNTSHIYTAKFSSSGVLRWKKSYSDGSYNGHNTPSDLLIGGNKLYVGGSVQKGLLNYDALILAYDTSNGNLIWTATRDFNSSLDGFVALTYNSGLQRVIGTGFTGANFTNWKYLTGTYNASNGGALSWDTSSASTVGFSSPVDIIKDGGDNIYITGFVVTGAGNDYNIRVVKFNSSFVKQWEKDFSWTFSDDRPTSMRFANNNHQEIYISGNSKSLSNGGVQNAVLLKINATNGNKIWEYKLNGAESSFEKIVENPANSRVYATGTIKENGKKHYLTQAFDANGNLLWARTFLKGSISEGKTILLQNDGGVIVSGRTFNDSLQTWQYTTVKYKGKENPKQIEYDSLGNKVAYANELIVKFNPLLVNQNFVNNRELTYGTLNDILSDSIINILSTKTGYNLHGTTIEKIFTRLRTSDSVSIARDTSILVRMPKFWSIFVLNFGNPASRSVSDIMDSLNTIPEIVFNTQKNLLFTTTLGPNDTYFKDSTGYGWQYRSLCDPVQSINYCPLWDAYKVGDNNFKVGVYDSGIKWDHEDFWDGTNAKGYLGHDYVTGSESYLNANNDATGHGTAMAGVIGAISNNDKGITGVVGGDGNFTNGCRLYNMRVLPTDTSFIPFSNLFNALVEGATKTPSGNLGYGLDVANMSFSLYSTSIYDKPFLLDGIRWLYKNGVTVVCSSGNDPAYKNNLPAGIEQENWLIHVVGTNNSGNFNTSFSRGSTADVGAPSVGNQFVLAGTDTAYKYWHPVTGGTSLSTALVSGVSANLMSYYCDATFDGMRCVRLWPDDVHFLLKKYTTPYAFPASDRGTGRVNAGETYRHIEYPYYEIMHRGIIMLARDTLSVQRNVNIFLNNNYEITPSNVIVDKGSYKADVYKIGGTSEPLNIPGNYTIIDHWVGNWASNLWNAPISTIVVPETNGTIVSVNNNFAEVYGYTYFIREHTSGVPINKWVPYNPFVDTGKLYFTLHLRNNDLVNVEEVKKDDFVTLYPNPTHNSFVVKFSEIYDNNTDIIVFDLTGKIILDESYTLNGNKAYIRLQGVSSGLYAVQIRNGNKTYFRKVLIE